MFGWIIILTGNKDNYKSLDELDFLPDPTTKLLSMYYVGTRASTFLAQLSRRELAIVICIYPSCVRPSSVNFFLKNSGFYLMAMVSLCDMIISKKTGHLLQVLRNQLKLKRLYQSVLCQAELDIVAIK